MARPLLLLIGAALLPQLAIAQPSPQPTPTPIARVFQPAAGERVARSGPLVISWRDDGISGPDVKVNITLVNATSLEPWALPNGRVWGTGSNTTLAIVKATDKSWQVTSITVELPPASSLFVMVVSPTSGNPADFPTATSLPFAFYDREPIDQFYVAPGDAAEAVFLGLGMSATAITVLLVVTWIERRKAAGRDPLPFVRSISRAMSTRLQIRRRPSTLNLGLVEVDNQGRFLQTTNFLGFLAGMGVRRRDAPEDDIPPEGGRASRRQVAAQANAELRAEAAAEDVSRLAATPAGARAATAAAGQSSQAAGVRARAVAQARGQPGGAAAVQSANPMRGVAVSSPGRPESSGGTGGQASGIASATSTSALMARSGFNSQSFRTDVGSSGGTASPGGNDYGDRGYGAPPMAADGLRRGQQADPGSPNPPSPRTQLAHAMAADAVEDAFPGSRPAGPGTRKKRPIGPYGK